MGKLYPVARFEDIRPGDVLISIDEKSEFEVYSVHESVPDRNIPPQLVTIITRADAGGGLCGMTGTVYTMDGRFMHDLRIKQKARRER